MSKRVNRSLLGDDKEGTAFQAQRTKQRRSGRNKWCDQSRGNKENGELGRLEEQGPAAQCFEDHIKESVFLLRSRRWLQL